MQVALRLYACTECGNEVAINTNHRGECYPQCLGRCRQILNPHTAREVVMRKQTPHRFLRDCQEEGE